jgi:hypothetical protein
VLGRPADVVGLAQATSDAARREPEVGLFALDEHVSHDRSMPENAGSELS